jgi:transposase-like protein
MRQNETNNGKKGGLLKGKPHYDKNGKSWCPSKPIEIVELAVKEYINSKKSISEIASKYGVDYGSCRHWIIKMGYKPRGNKESNSVSYKIKKECSEHFANGTPLKEIKAKYGVCGHTIRVWAKEFGYMPKTLSERMGITEELKIRGVELYNIGLNLCQVAKIIGVSNNTVRLWVKQKSVLKTHSEVMSEVHARIGYKNARGTKGKENTPFGDIYFDSNYEQIRIKQLIDNNDVKLISRCNDYILYKCNGKERRYNPDFYIEYKNGRKVVEEIKPYDFVNKFNNREKFSAAKSFYKDKSIVYKVVLENIIYGKKIAKSR